MNFGLEGYLGAAIYALALAILLYAAFRHPVAGLYLLAPLIPLQTLR